MNILGVDNILLAVGNLEQARAFYGRALGLPEKFAFLETGIVCYRLGSEEPGLLLRVDPAVVPAPPRSTPRIWLEVPDARAAMLFLQGRGVAPLGSARQVRTGWVVEIADPWGNAIGFTDYQLAPDQARRPEPPEE